MDSRISAVVCFIGKRPAADMDTLATAVNLSPSRLRHLFRLEMATALHAYLKQQRLSRAAELLKTTFLTVKEVSAAMSPVVKKRGNLDTWSTRAGAGRPRHAGDRRFFCVSSASRFL
jgi:methylphosphotriester-DNA--protein-cysteine methyltransferase